MTAAEAAPGAATGLLTATIDFPSCIDRLKRAAHAEGISAGVIESVLNRVEPSERVLELDRRQPEFTSTFADYFNRRVTPERVARGRQLRTELAPLLQTVLDATGVPPHYLLAFWGLETNFGGYLGNMWIPASLTTLACDDRRSSYFSSELLSALKLIDRGDVSADAMQGSWAGAMGQVQFMPTAYLRYAVDQDRDGRRDLWGSLPDALASGGHFLKTLGWQPGTRWGREVLLPAPFDYLENPPGTTRTLLEWRQRGITDTSGQPVSALAVDARLLLPAGHRGPAFLVYENFGVIMGWNRSEYYALSVGHLADRIAGGGALHRPPPEDDLKFSNADMLRIQKQLAALGFDPGEPDGRLGPATRKAVGEFQRGASLIPDGHLDAAVIAALDARSRDGT
ncbi:MAG: lytic murein transglycosylase [Pseudomonadales bacterium]